MSFLGACNRCLWNFTEVVELPCEPGTAPDQECTDRAACDARLRIVDCPGCGDSMDVRRTLEANVELTGGVCTDCKLHPARTATQTADELRRSIFGENRTGSPAAFARCMEAEAR